MLQWIEIRAKMWRRTGCAAEGQSGGRGMSHDISLFTFSSASSLTCFYQFVGAGFDLCRVVRELIQRVVSGFDAGSRKHTLVSHVRTVVRESGAQDGRRSLWPDALQVGQGRDGCTQVGDLAKGFLCCLLDSEFGVDANKIEQLTTILAASQLPLRDLNQLLVRHVLVLSGMDAGGQRLVEPVSASA